LLPEEIEFLTALSQPSGDGHSKSLITDKSQADELERANSGNLRFYRHDPHDLRSPLNQVMGVAN